MIWTNVLSRREALEVMTAGNIGWLLSKAIYVEKLPPLPRGDDVIAVWQSNPQVGHRLPSMFVVADGGAHEFLAWTSTYVRDLFPYTAFCRVVELPIAMEYFPMPADMTFQIDEGIIAGLVIGEVLTQSVGREVPIHITRNVFGATFSFAVARLLAVVGSTQLLEHLERGWERARALASQPRMDVPVSALRAVWNIVLGVSERTTKRLVLWDNGGLIRDAWRNLSETGGFQPNVRDALGSFSPQFEGMHELLQRPREQRVARIEEGLRVLASAPDEQRPTAAFLAGYFTSLLGPGSLEHFGMLVPFARAFPTAFMWYGACSSVVGRMDSVATGNRLAKRILRDLTLPDRICDRPRCDIALEELAILRGDLAIPEAHDDCLDVDLLPCVATTLRLQPSETKEEDERRARHNHQINKLLQDLDENQRRSVTLTEHLRRVIVEGAGNGRKGDKRRKK